VGELAYGEGAFLGQSGHFFCRGFIDKCGIFSPGQRLGYRAAVAGGCLYARLGVLPHPQNAASDLRLAGAVGNRLRGGQSHL